MWWCLTGYVLFVVGAGCWADIVQGWSRCNTECGTTVTHRLVVQPKWIPGLCSVSDHPSSTQTAAHTVSLCLPVAAVWRWRSKDSIVPSRLHLCELRQRLEWPLQATNYLVMSMLASGVTSAQSGRQLERRWHWHNDISWHLEWTSIYRQQRMNVQPIWVA